MNGPPISRAQRMVRAAKGINRRMAALGYSTPAPRPSVGRRRDLTSEEIAERILSGARAYLIARAETAALLTRLQRPERE